MRALFLIITLLFCVIDPWAVYAGSSPEETLDQYIQAVRAWDAPRVKELYLVQDFEFYLPEAVDVVRYEVRKRKVLSIEDLQNLQLKTTPSAGDVQLDVFQVRNVDGVRKYKVVSFWFRQVEEDWKIYEQRAWGGR